MGKWDDTAETMLAEFEREARQIGADEEIDACTKAHAAGMAAGARRIYDKIVTHPMPVVPDDWGPVRELPCVRCPGCGFQFAAEHRCHDGTYRCPECGEGGSEHPTPSADPTEGTDGIEPGTPIASTDCPCCGAHLEIEHGDDPGEIACIGTPVRPAVPVPSAEACEAAAGELDLRARWFACSENGAAALPLQEVRDYLRRIGASATPEVLTPSAEKCEAIAVHLTEAAHNMGRGGLLTHAAVYREVADYLRSLHGGGSRPQRPRIVCLCGSTRFYTDFQRANYERTMAGEIVLSVGFYPHSQEQAHGQEIGCTPEQKESLDALHLRKIDLCDYVYVLNVGGYIGSSTRKEIEYAEKIGRPVEYMKPLHGGGKEGV